MAHLHVNFLKSLVAIGIEEKNKFRCSATGFLIGFIAKNSKDPAKRQFWVFLVTNRHVFHDKKYVHLRFNTKEGRIKTFKQSLFFFGRNRDKRWLAHKSERVDLALLNINPNILLQHSIDFIPLPEETFAYIRNFKKIGIEVGDAVYVLGFPLGISGNIQNYPCVKWGILSRIDREILKDTKSFLIDSSVFPGNSGGPVIYRPTIVRLDKTVAVDKPYLLGVVSKYLPYQEMLYTHQTTPPSVVSSLQENSGLSFVVPMDFIRQIFRNWKKEKKKLIGTQRQPEREASQPEIRARV